MVLLSSSNKHWKIIVKFELVLHYSGVQKSNVEKVLFVLQQAGVPVGMWQSMTEAVFLTLGQSRSSHFKRLGLRL